MTGSGILHDFEAFPQLLCNPKARRIMRPPRALDRAFHSTLLAPLRIRQHEQKAGKLTAHLHEIAEKFTQCFRRQSSKATLKTKSASSSNHTMKTTRYQTPISTRCFSRFMGARLKDAKNAWRGGITSAPGYPTNNAP